MIDTGLSGVIAAVFVSGVGRAGVVSASTEFDKSCVGSSNNGAVGNESLAIEADVGCALISGDESVSDWLVVIWGMWEGVLAATPSSAELVVT
jgi:hypothetical protein